MTDSANIDALVRAFARLLAASWHEVKFACSMSTTPYFVENWLEAQWELLVEAALPPGVFLSAYGDGADFFDMSSRVHRPDTAPTHMVVCSPNEPFSQVVDSTTGNLVRLPPGGVPLREFVARADSWYERSPPFDCVLIEHEGLDCVVSAEQLSFSLRALAKSSA